MITESLRWAMGVVNAITLVACANGSDPTTDDPIVESDPPPATSPPATSPATLAVLFIGNSLTYTNDLPRTLSGIATSGGDHIRTDMVASPKVTLESHLGTGSEAVAAIQRGGWDYVVLQGAWIHDSTDRASLMDAVMQFDVLVRAAGARTAVYMVWPPADHADDFCLTGSGSAAAAAAVNGLLLPVGGAWELTLQQHPEVELYDPDGTHPAPLGTYLAAITIYERLTGRDARGLPDRAVLDGVAVSASPSEIQQLQEAAHTAASEGVAHRCASGVEY